MESSAFEQLRQLLQQDRSIRRFRQTPIGRDTLLSLVELTRFCASGRNLQPLRYRLVTEPDECAGVYPALTWAGYYKDWDGPEEGRRPMAYLVQCLDTDLTEKLLCDDGLHLQTITLGATALGIGCCIIKAFNAPLLSEVLKLPGNMTPLYVLALGYPDEKAIVTDLPADGSIIYYRDEAENQCVPKRSLESLIIA